jgi:hypothetical protein
MVESTARRERGGEPTSAPLATYLWEVPQKPVAVRLAFDFIDRLETRGYRELPLTDIARIGDRRRVAGFGGSRQSSDRGRAGLRAIPCDYSRGPVYRLADADLARFERVIEQHSGAGSMPVAGYFRAHSRKGLSLDADDVAFLDARFRGPHYIALLVRPFATKTSVGGIFIREDGVFRRRRQLFGVSVPFRAIDLLAVDAARSGCRSAAAGGSSRARAQRSAARQGQCPSAGGADWSASRCRTGAGGEVFRARSRQNRPQGAGSQAGSRCLQAGRRSEGRAPARPAAPEPKPAAKEVKPAAAVVKEAAPVKPAASVVKELRPSSRPSPLQPPPSSRVRTGRC